MLIDITWWSVSGDALNHVRDSSVFVSLVMRVVALSANAPMMPAAFGGKQRARVWQAHM
jgi:hypothetical protein